MAEPRIEQTGDELARRIRSLEAERLRPAPNRPQASPQGKRRKTQRDRTDDPQGRQRTLQASDTYSAAVAQLAELRRRPTEDESSGPRDSSAPTRKEAGS